MNNFACALWWSKMNLLTAELAKSSSPNLQIIEKMAFEIFHVIVKFKQAIILIENIKIEKDEVLLINIKLKEKGYKRLDENKDKDFNSNEVKLNILKYIVSHEIEKKIDLNFVKDLVT